MIDDRTAYLDLPLPHATNLLDEDVVRLRSALAAVDGEFSAIHAILTESDSTLDTLAEIVTYIKANRGDINSILTGKHDKTDWIDRAGQATAVSVTYNGDGTLNVMTETLGSNGTRTTTMTYNGDKTVATVTINSPHLLRTETYTYAAGKLSSISVSEAAQ